MSSTAHWLVLSTVATRQKGFIYTETEHLTHAHAPYLDTSICTVREKNMCTCWFRHINSSIKSPSPRIISWELEQCCRPSAGFYPPFPHFHPSPFPFLFQCHFSCVGGEAASILDSLKETGGNLHLVFTIPCCRICLPTPPLKWYICRGLSLLNLTLNKDLKLSGRRVGKNWNTEIPGCI